MAVALVVMAWAEAAPGVVAKVSAGTVCASLEQAFWLTRPMPAARESGCRSWGKDIEKIAQSDCPQNTEGTPRVPAEAFPSTQTAVGACPATYFSKSDSKFACAHSAQKFLRNLPVSSKSATNLPVCTAAPLTPQPHPGQPSSRLASTHMSVYLRMCASIMHSM